MKHQKKTAPTIPAPQHSKRRLEFSHGKENVISIRHNLNGRKLTKWVTKEEAKEIEEQKKKEIEKLQLKIKQATKDKKESIIKSYRGH